MPGDTKHIYKMEDVQLQEFCYGRLITNQQIKVWAPLGSKLKKILKKWNHGRGRIENECIKKKGYQCTQIA